MARILNTAVLLLSLSFTCSAAPAPAAKHQLPELPGRYNVGRIDLELIDKSRNDPYAPTTAPRDLMVSVIYPSVRGGEYPYADYLPFKTSLVVDKWRSLPNGTLSTVQPRSRLGAPITTDCVPPIVIFSPGQAAPRLVYSTYVEAMASHGYIVVAVDHPYETEVLEYPDGRMVYPVAINNTAEELALALDTRARDVSFVLDALAKDSIAKKIPGVKGGLDTSKVAMFGHSLGGATAAQVMAMDRRVVAGINMDGGIYSSVRDIGLDNPFMILGRPDHNRTSDKTWETLWGNLRGWKLNLLLTGSGHNSFTDLPTLLDVLGMRGLFPPEVIEGELLIGTIQPARLRAVVGPYLTAFMDMFLKKNRAEILKGPSPKYPEMVFY